MRIRRTAAAATILVACFGPPVLAGFFGTDLFLPSVGRKLGLGDTFWHTALWVHNPSAASVAVTVQYLPRGSAALPPGMSQTFTIPAGGTWQDSDAINTLFPGLSGYGALRITSTAEVLANCRMYNQPGTMPLRDTTGQDYAAIPSSFAIGSGQVTQVLGAFSDLSNPDPDFRTGFGYVEVSGNPANVRVKVFGPDGAQLGSWDDPTPLQPFENRYYTDMPVKFPAASGTNLRLQIEVTGGSGKIIAVGSLVSNGPSDGTTFEMAFADQLLGIQTVVHDSTLTGNGAVVSPLGLANGAVVKAKLSAAGGTSGQVLATDGANLVWQNSGLTLPFSGSGAGTPNVFQVASTSGPAIVGTLGQSTGQLGTGYGVVGTHTGGGIGVFGSSVSGPGVSGDSRTSYGVYGTSTSNDAIRGETTGSAAGVQGISSSGPGVEGTSTSSSGVQGASTSGYGLYGMSTSNDAIHGETTGGGSGVQGVSSSGPGVQGASTSSYGVYGRSTGYDAVRGETTGGGAGIQGISSNGPGVRGVSTSGDGVYGQSSTGYGVHGARGNFEGFAGYSDGGVLGRDNSSGNYGYLGMSSKAGYFSGTVEVRGNFSVTGGYTKNFLIDHPLDPENKVLVHAAIESSEVLNVYSGNVITDDDGRAVVQLPDWFEAENTDFRYQLTVIGRFAQAIVEQEIDQNRFVVRTNLGKVKVSWHVTARRNDPGMRLRPFVAERDKPAEERGTYLEPEAYGQPKEKGVDWVRHPELMREIKAGREAAAAAKP